MLIDNLKKLFALLLIIGFSFMANCDAGSGTEDGDPLESALYEVKTADGLILKLMRYRPAEENGLFRTGKQPVLVLPGLLMNLNSLISHTPEEKKDAYADMELPEDLASWAVGEPYVAADPMRYYSIAHYLWVKGYDVWMANYRGIGRGEYKGDNGNKYVNLDVWATLDTPAIIDKVKDVTGLKPVIGGHSTGGLVCYLYLQGVTMDVDEFISAGDDYVPHVKYDQALAVERNQGIKGFIGLDPAGIPPLPLTGIIDILPIWAVLQVPVVLPFDGLIETLLADKTFGSIPYLTFNVLFGAISALDDTIALPPEFDLFGSLRMWEMANTNKYVLDYGIRYGMSNLHMRNISQYADWGVHNVLREHFKNGADNHGRILPPHPGSDYDDLVVYDQINLMTVPAISIFSQSPGLVETGTMVKNLMEAKAPHANDEWYEIEGAAHIDIPSGNNAPTDMYPKIGAWLDKIK